ncbi:hypothetical protein Srut_53090 [Streptomyces rutgersensis]|nr:hypothetical protein Srut_53090 [Streptomyces rutgersensis]
MGAGRAGEETVLDLVVEAAEEPVGDGATLNGAGGQHLAAQVPRRGPSGPVISLPSRLGEGKAGTEPGEGLEGGRRRRHRRRGRNHRLPEGRAGPGAVPSAAQ